jgi:hypothetical protein
MCELWCVSAGPTKGDTSVTHMQLDGEPWPQAIPAGDAEPLTVRLENPQSTMLSVLCPSYTDKGTSSFLSGTGFNMWWLCPRRSMLSHETPLVPPAACSVRCITPLF